MVKIVDKLSDKGYPVHDKNYKSAHNKANKVEKKSDPKAYAEINKMDRSLKKGELAGKHTKDGKVEIDKKYNKSHDGVSGQRIKNNLVLHEITEKKAQSKDATQKRHAETNRSKM